MRGDDIMSLRNFLCNFVTFWSSQGNLSSKKAGKLKKMQRLNVSRFVKNVIWSHKAECIVLT